MRQIRFISILLVCLLISSFSAVLATADEYEATLDIQYEINDKGNIVIVASLNNINTKNGIIDCEYDVNYDTNALKLLSADANIPDAWKADYSEDGDSDVVDLSHETEPGSFYWAVLTTKAGAGIHDDNQLFITFEFQKLNNSTTKIEFTNGLVATELLTAVGSKPTYEIYQISTNNANISIDLNAPDKPNIDTSVSNPITIPRPESAVEIESDEIPEDFSGGPITIPGVVDKNDKSDHKDDKMDASKVDNQSNVDTMLFWVLIAVVVVVGGFVAVYAVLVKKKAKESNND